MVMLLEKKYLYFGIFLVFLSFIAISGYNSIMQTPQTYNNENISFQYTSDFQNSSKFPLLQGDDDSSWANLANFNSNITQVGIIVQKSSNNGSDIKTLGTEFTQDFKRYGDNIVSSSEITNPNGVNMWKIVHIAKDTNQSYLFYDAYFLQANNVYFIQIVGYGEKESSAQKVADMVFNSTKVLK